tara:strand:+ start:1224 stop:1472 length:249 start_codon:yes stop_codon:yes gene_type:complete
MKLKVIGSNQTQIDYKDGTVIFFSYETPVAGYLPEIGYVRSDQFYSVTTSKHINKWLEGVDAVKVPQEKLTLYVYAMNNCPI